MCAVGWGERCACSGEAEIQGHRRTHGHLPQNAPGPPEGMFFSPHYMQHLLIRDEDCVGMF